MKKILFLCVENSCRSQMAEALAKFHGKDRFKIGSAGSHPSGKIHAMAIEVLKEGEFPYGDLYSKGISGLPHILWDVVVGMGCGDACPTLIAKKRVEWNIEDPKGSDLEFFRKIRGEIEERVKALLIELSSSKFEVK